MKLLISNEVVEKIVKFAGRYGISEPVIEELRIKVPISNYFVVFFQPERYDKAIVCYFCFVDDVGFFFEDVCQAIDGSLGCNRMVVGKHAVIGDVLKRNDNYINHVLEYCEKNINVLTSVPPSWFQRAVNISDAATRRIFPDMADEDLRKKAELWDSWQKQSR